ncbi:MAG: hypothetical protein ABJG78_14960 [Cyclobacteriaceae bacterium]
MTKKGPKKEPIYLNYRFDNMKDFQGIYYGRLLGSTLAIGAKFEPTYDPKTGHIIKLEAEFLSRTMGGTVNFGLRGVAQEIVYDPKRAVNTHFLNFELNMLFNQDADFDPIELTFQEPFDKDNHYLNVLLTEDNIGNWVDGRVNSCTEDSDNDRSCNTTFWP